MAGLLAARSLADFFDTVTVVERDPLPDTDAVRRGVPQGRHSACPVGPRRPGDRGVFPQDPRRIGPRRCAVLRRPGSVAAALQCGRAPGGAQRQRQLVYRLLRDTAVPGGRRPEASARHPNVTLLDEHNIVALTSTLDRHRVTGARVVSRRTGEAATLNADLVVDATGRAARTPTWLDGLGYDRPTEDRSWCI